MSAHINEMRRLVDKSRSLARNQVRRFTLGTGASSSYTFQLHGNGSETGYCPEERNVVSGEVALLAGVYP